MTNNYSLFLKSCLAAAKDMGIKHIVLSPGSRSTPLAIICEEDSDLTVYMDVDERSAAFFALGLAKVSAEPVICICTSGTAAANYFPAICEAMENHIPLIIFTTDRPHELRHVGAPQTMEQQHLYGNKVKCSVEFALPDNSKKMCQYAYSQVFQLISRSLTAPIGPVHANFPFREPLIPLRTDELPDIKRKKKYSGIKQMSPIPNELVEIVNREKGWLLIGENTDSLCLEPLITLAEKLNWPIFSDPLANVKTHSVTSGTIINHYDLIMNRNKISSDMTPEVIIRVGRSLLSKSLNNYLSSYENDYILFDETGQIPDYSHQVSIVIDADINQWMSDMIEKISINESDWLQKWQQLDARCDEVLIESQAMTSFSELSVTSLILDNITDNSQLFVSNSMPIRDVDTVLKKTNRYFSLYGNRAINGIDGIISSAFGMTAYNKDVWNGLIIGDISFFHSLNGLAVGSQYQLPLTIFVINNNGGGIFSMLPQNALPKKQFETLFGTPQSIDFEQVANMFKCDFFKITNQKELIDVLDEVMKKKKLRIIEIITSRTKNKDMRHQLNLEIKRDKNE